MAVLTISNQVNRSHCTMYIVYWPNGFIIRFFLFFFYLSFANYRIENLMRSQLQLVTERVVILLFFFYDLDRRLRRRFLHE